MTGAPSTYFVIWEFRVRPDRQADFERIYGADGDWAGLFRRSPQFLGTQLLRDADQSGRYLTVDQWMSREALQQFKQAHRAEYEAFDRQCESLTEGERMLGEFEGEGRQGQVPRSK